MFCYKPDDFDIVVCSVHTLYRVCSRSIDLWSDVFKTMLCSSYQQDSIDWTEPCVCCYCFTGGPLLVASRCCGWCTFCPITSNNGLVMYAPPSPHNINKHRQIHARTHAHFTSLTTLLVVSLNFDPISQFFSLHPHRLHPHPFLFIALSNTLQCICLHCFLFAPSSIMFTLRFSFSYQ